MKGMEFYMENLIIQVFSILIQSLVELYIVMTLAKRLSNPEGYDKKQTGLMFAAIVVILTSSTLLNYINMQYLKLILFITLEIVAMKFILKVKLKHAILIEIICQLLFFISEIIITIVFTSILKVDLTNSSNFTLANLSVTIFINLTAFLVIFAINKLLNNKIKINFKIKDLSTKNLVFLLVSSAIYIFPQTLIFAITSYSYPIPFLILNCVQFIIINIFTFYFVKKDMEFAKSRSDLVTSELHNKTLIGMVDGVRTLKHDYNNIIQSLNGYVVTKQYDKLDAHIKSLLKECNGINNLSSIDPKVFNDPAIYGIVGSKYFLANEKGIPFEFDITTNIVDINFPKPELSRILGILLDNAVEATLKCENPFIRLQMRYEKRKNADIIKVFNTYDTSIDINLTDIYKKGYSSKKVKSGIGLWEVKKLISQNRNSQIYASIEEKMFTQTIVIER